MEAYYKAFYEIIIKNSAKLAEKIYNLQVDFKGFNTKLNDYFVFEGLSQLNGWPHRLSPHTIRTGLIRPM